jgi:hypothetical protein
VTHDDSLLSDRIVYLSYRYHLDHLYETLLREYQRNNDLSIANLLQLSLTVQ